MEGTLLKTGVKFVPVLKSAISVVFRGLPPLVGCPPTSKTLPLSDVVFSSGSKTAVPYFLPNAIMFPADVHLPVMGSHIYKDCFWPPRNTRPLGITIVRE